MRIRLRTENTVMAHKEINIKYEEYGSPDELQECDRELVAAASDATANSYSPYSKFQVGAAVRLGNGKIVSGANQENIAYPSGLCAERTAMFYANASCPGVPMEAIAIVARQDGKFCESPAAPCGACRQVMAEYQTLTGRNMKIILAGSRKILVFEKVDDLLPFIFDSLK